MAKRIDVNFSNPSGSPKGCAVTFGCFDGIHLGHRKILSRLVELARQRSLKTALYLFHPHPQAVLNPAQGFKRLFTLTETKTLLQEQNLDFFGLIPFDLEMSRWSPKTFLSSFVAPFFQPQLIVAGHDFAFGANARGSFSDLKVFSQGTACQVRQVPPVRRQGQVVSTSRIKKLLQKGCIRQANALLGRKFILSGSVVRGHGRGRRIGYRTANLFISSDKMLPKKGVYAIQARFQSEWHPGVLNIGSKPTFLKNSRAVFCEAHIINRNFNLYDKQLHLRICRFLREERLFSNTEALKSQIQKDIKKALK